MCGLFGCITKKDFKLSPEIAKKRNAVIRGLALAMEKRGDKSTGVAGINDNYCETYRKPVSARIFVDREPFQKFLNSNYNIIVGHTRMPTMGAVVERNAHPFKVGRIVGAHNGQLYNWRSINDKVEVDSQAIFHQLNEDKNDFKKAFAKLYGSFAITWFDVKNPNLLHFVVDGNPLFVIYVHQARTYFYASEYLALEAIVNTHFNVKRKTRAWLAETSKTYTISTKLQIRKEDVKFGDYNTYPTNRPTTYSHGYSEHWQKPDYEDPNEGCNVNSRHIPTYEERHGVKNPYRTTHEGDHIMLDDIEQLHISEMQLIEKKIATSGCDVCSLPIDLSTQEGFYWHSPRNEVICLDCLSTSTIPFEDVLWIEWSDYKEIIEELDEIASEFA